MPEVTFLGPKRNVRRTIQANPGENLRAAAIRNKFGIYPHIFKILNCRGRGLCTSCAVEIVEGRLPPRNDVENARLPDKPHLRLACQIAVQDNMVIKTRGNF